MHGIESNWLSTTSRISSPSMTPPRLYCRTQHFKDSIAFIHESRLKREGCLVHCLAGVSRSVTLVVAYIMTVTDLGWQEALAAVRAVRSSANPNLGFQRQLADFESTQAAHYRQWLRECYKQNPFNDAENIRRLLSKEADTEEAPSSIGTS
ncbi:dual specificity protein phosphatase 22-B isoform X2 [Paramormyrops kingsleyae]|uniref:dual specificity protein phosphatase 22-B isoform X2 n=1 Tax=Paramormyrops kingsleyae TaxID=1676925 RepID=UPI003B977006